MIESPQSSSSRATKPSVETTKARVETSAAGGDVAEVTASVQAGATVFDTVDPTKPRLVALSRSKRMLHAGPLPDAATLRAYDKLSPGAAGRPINNSLNQSRHRRRLESRMVSSDTRQA